MRGCGRTVARRTIIGWAMAAAVAPAAWADQCLVALDVGQSRARPGVISARGVPEWLFNRNLARSVDRALRAAGIPGIILNPGGLELAPRTRIALARELGATLLVSLHHDSVRPQYLSDWSWQGRTWFYSDRFSGFGLIVADTNGRPQESRRVAVALADGLLDQGMVPSLHHAEPIPGEGRPLADASRGIYRNDALPVLAAAPMPALVLEAGIIVNREDELTLASDRYRTRIARAVVAAAGGHCQRVSGQATR